MTEKTVVQAFLDEVLAEAEKCANEKITRAMRLFVRCDETYKGIVLMGFKGPLTAQSLRQWFDTMDLMDGLDSLIDDMEDEVRHNARLSGEAAKRLSPLEPQVVPHRDDK